MNTLLERAANLFSDSAHVVRTPSLTNTDDSGPSDEPLLSPPPMPSPTLSATTKPRQQLVVDTSSIPLPLPGPQTLGSPTSTRMDSPRTHVRTISQASSMLMPIQKPIIVALCEVAVVANLLRYLTWHEFRNLVTTSRAVRAVLDADDQMDVILARFLQGYQFGVRLPNQIRISLDDLETYILSQHISLHLYPTHALTVVDSLMNMMQLVSATTERFQRLSAAHSRFVLLLRSRLLLAPNPPEIDDSAVVSAAAASKDATITRQLTFPAPLFCETLAAREKAQTKSTTSTQLTNQRQRRLLSASTTSLSSLFGLSGKSSRRKRPIPPPSPVSRRTSVLMSPHKRTSTYAGHPARSRSTPPQTASRSEDEDHTELKPPRPFYRRHSSLPGSSASSTRGSLGVVSESAAEHSNSSSNDHMQLALPSGPHDPLYAAVRGRAPVLRVFVPTDSLSPAAIKACETSLWHAGLWDWMVPGDIVCNLGYVPRSEGDQPESSSQAPKVDEFGVVGVGSIASLLGDTKPEDPRGWLIFTGKMLVPYFPPAPPPPDIDALRLPGPAYYAHLGPPTAGLVYALKIPRASSERTMRLERSAGLVRTSWGAARVRRWIWVAEFRVERTGQMGEDWAGEWVLEGMGTREGEKVLLDTMKGEDMRFWEYVREKSGNGRIWLRLVDTPALSVLDPGSTAVLPADETKASS
ncbi:hypothetical protein FRC07_003363 [Ceratobasidium sp. 392]|nr:hypothetical protein FRC07_003363 [Ceratobasidium sp. 392]